MTEIHQALVQFFIENKPDDCTNFDIASIDLFQERVLDSLGVFQYATYVEQTFDLHFLPSDIVVKNFRTIPALASLIEAKLKVRHQK